MTTEHTQETKIAILEAKVEHMMGHVKELTLRVRANEKVVAIVSAIGIGAGGIVGTTAFAPKADAHMGHSLPTGEWIQKMRDYESKKDRTPIEDMINSSLKEFNYGSDDTTESKELLQLSGDKDRQSSGWRYDRCNDRSWFRSLQKGESKDSWCRHSRETNEGPRRESTGPRRYELVERKTN